MSLAGKKIVFTGALAIKRAVAAAQATAAGAKVSGSVSGNTDIVVAGPDAITTSKILTAQAKGTLIWTEDDFQKALAARAPAAKGRGDVTRIVQQADGHPNGVAFRTSKTGNPVEDIPNGTSVTFLKLDGEWCHIVYSGKKGWVKVRNLKAPKRGAPAGGDDGSPKKAKTGKVTKSEFKAWLDSLGIEGKSILSDFDELEREEFEAAQPLKDHVRTSLVAKFGKGKDPKDNTPTSKLGGVPCLKSGDRWPECEGCSQKMRFMLQVNLAASGYQTVKGIGIEGSRRDGLLQLWCCDMEEGDCDTFEAFSGAHFLRVVPPKDFAKFERSPKMPDGVEPHKVKVIQNFQRRRELPSSEEVELDGADGVWDLLGNNTTSGDKIGGWPNWCQSVEYPECPECSESMTNVLFQLEADTIEGVSIGDSGTAHITQCKKHFNSLAFAWACC